MIGKRVLVTGGAGFIGSHLVDKLFQKDCEVCVVDNLSTGKLENIEKHVKDSNLFFENAEVQSENLKKVFRVFRPEIVYHLAAIPGVHQSVLEPRKSAEVNLVGTANVLACAKEYEAKSVIFASSSSVYGGADVLPTKESYAEFCTPKSPYAMQKKMGEEMCKYYKYIENLGTVSMRFFNVFGPRQRSDSAYSAVIPSFLVSKLKGSEVKVYGDGEQTRDFCYIDNVVQALYSVGEKDLLDEDFPDSFNVGYGEQTSLNNLLDFLKIEQYKYVEDRPGDVKHSMADIKRAKEMFNYCPEYSITDGLSLTIDWYKKELENE